MRRPLPVTRWFEALGVTFLCLLALGPPGAAQEEGCTETDPCPIEVSVDENGFAGDREWTLTQGDWHFLRVLNADATNATHTLRLEGYGVDLQVDSLQERESAPIRFDTPGQFALSDAPSGDAAWILVTEFDATEIDNATSTPTATTTQTNETGGPGTGPADEDTPALPLAVAALSLAAAARARRTRA